MPIKTAQSGNSPVPRPAWASTRAPERLDHLTRILGSDLAVAASLGVSRAQPRRWREGQVPDPENRDRLIGLDTIISLLSGFLAESSIPKWLEGANGHLDNRRPIHLIQQGHIAEVIGAIEAEKSGAFT